VQVGDPFTEKLLIEACLELYDAQLVEGIQDLGGAGPHLRAHRDRRGREVRHAAHLDRVPLREASMEPHEVLASESQERMLAIVTPANLPAVLAIAEKWGVLATAIGEVVEGDRLEVLWHGEAVVDVPPGLAGDDGPVYERPMARPADLDGLRRRPPPPHPASTSCPTCSCAWSPRPNLCSRRWVVEQYDRIVLGDTVLAWPRTPASCACRRRPGSASPSRRTATAATRASTRTPVRSSRSRGLPQRRRHRRRADRRHELPELRLAGGPRGHVAVRRGDARSRDGCRALATPVTGGNVSFYNSTADVAINPTPVVGVLGLFDDVARRTPIGFQARASRCCCSATRATSSAGRSGPGPSTAPRRRTAGGRPRPERVLAEVLVAGSRDGMLSSAHDLSDGGLAQALVESSLAGGIGARVVLPAGPSPFVQLFSESAGRALVTVPRSEELRFTEMCDARGLPCTRIGVTDGTSLDVQDVLVHELEDLREAHEATLPALFGPLAGDTAPANPVVTAPATGGLHPG
jgi:phosphoribosylformylglycinamidine synthase